MNRLIDAIIGVGLAGLVIAVLAACLSVAAAIGVVAWAVIWWALS